MTDAATGQPVKRFRVVPGYRGSDPVSWLLVRWDEEGGFDSADGRYRHSSRAAAVTHVLRIQAEGYQPAVSRDIRSDEGQVQVDFQLQAAAGCGLVCSVTDRPEQA